MPLYLIPRHLRPGMSDEEREFLITMVISAGTWYPEVKWLRSYAIDEPDRTQSWCTYSGPTQAAVQRHAEQCGAPFDSVLPVEEWLPVEGDHAEPGADAHYLLVERTFEAGTPRDLAWQIIVRGNTLAASDGLAWMRTLWSEELHRAWCVFMGDDAQAAREHATRVGLPCDSVEAVVLNLPSQWEHIYDMLLLPHHWEERVPVEV